MTVSIQRLRDRWPLADRIEVREALLRAYAEPERSYHDLQHLSEVLDRLDELGTQEPTVLLAAWFHDGVYDGQPGAEVRSADWARRDLAGLACVDEVARLVELTEQHRPGPEDRPGQLLSDADLAILAAPAPRYAEYAAAIRREYAHVSDRDFRAGRSRILSDLLAKPTLFHTPVAVARWEESARANVAAELLRLGSPQAGPAEPGH